MQLIKNLLHPRPKNSLFTIFPYEWKGIWMFDDASTGLVGEAFVSGMPNIILKMCEDKSIPTPQLGFAATFSEYPFPDATHTLHRVRELDTSFGNWYQLTCTSLVGWLCPALLRYFTSPPETIWIKVTK